MVDGEVVGRKLILLPGVPKRSLGRPTGERMR
jgi:hypothetical protein